MKFEPLDENTNNKINLYKPKYKREIRTQNNIINCKFIKDTNRVFTVKISKGYKGDDMVESYFINLKLNFIKKIK